jgi:hypothetical protein
MIEHVWSVVCNNSSIDEESKTISLLNVLEQLVIYTDATDDLNLPIQLEVFSLWTREEVDMPAKGKMQVQFCDDKNACTKQAEIEIDLSQAVFCRTKMKLFGLKLKGAGRYKFIVELSEDAGATWKKVASLPVQINYEPIPPEYKNNPGQSPQ